MSEMVNGKIKLNSEPGKRSTFTFYLPQEYIFPGQNPVPSRAHDVRPPVAPTEQEVPKYNDNAPEDLKPEENGIEQGVITEEAKDDRASIKSGDCSLLIIEDDQSSANLLGDIAHQKEFKVLMAYNGEQGLSLAKKFKPDAITLDIQLPDIDGWTVLDRLKLDSQLRHIPVHIITVEEERMRGLWRGAFAYIEKPVSKDALDKALSSVREFVERSQKSLLIVEDNSVDRDNIISLLGNGDITITAKAMKGDREKCIEAGASDYITKPVNQDQLLSLLRVWMYR